MKESKKEKESKEMKQSKKENNTLFISKSSNTSKSKEVQQNQKEQKDQKEQQEQKDINQETSKGLKKELKACANTDKPSKQKNEKKNFKKKNMKRSYSYSTEEEKKEKVGGLTEMEEMAKVESREAGLRDTNKTAKKAMRRTKKSQEFIDNLKPVESKQIPMFTEDDKRNAIEPAKRIYSDKEMKLRKLMTEEQLLKEKWEWWTEKWIDSEFDTAHTAFLIGKSYSYLREQLRKHQTLKNMFELAVREKSGELRYLMINQMHRGLQKGQNPDYALLYARVMYTTEEKREMLTIPEHLLGSLSQTEEEKAAVVAEIAKYAVNIDHIIYDTRSFPPDYIYVRQLRATFESRAEMDKNYVKGLLTYYSENPIDFISHWTDTLNPRNASIEDGRPQGSKVPFVLFKKQRELITGIETWRKAKENGLIEKSRDMGATWLCCAHSVWIWLFFPDSVVGWVSQKESQVDNRGSTGSIFEKIRSIIKGLPPFLKPDGFDAEKDLLKMKLINRANGATIDGLTGDDPGRGSRATIAYCDESAHWENAAQKAKALCAYTDTIIDISSVNGPGNVFHGRRVGGTEWKLGDPAHKGTNVFVFDWRDHPLRNQAWYDKMLEIAKKEGGLTKLWQEYDRRYDASVEGIIINHEWVAAAVDFEPEGEKMTEGKLFAGFDIAAGGLDKNALVIRKGAKVLLAEEWAQPEGGDAMKTIIKVVKMLNNFEGRNGEYKNQGIDVMYDSIALGQSVKGVIDFLTKENKIREGVRFWSWNASEKPLNADDPVDPKDNKNITIRDKYSNMKAQGWDSLKWKFMCTYWYVTNTKKSPTDKMISIPSYLKNKDKLMLQLSQPVWQADSSGRGMVNKTPDGNLSPNLADALMMCYHPYYQGRKPIRVGRVTLRS